MALASENVNLFTFLGGPEKGRLFNLISLFPIFFPFFGGKDVGSIKIAFLFAPGWLEEVAGAGVFFAGDGRVLSRGPATLGGG